VTGPGAVDGAGGQEGGEAAGPEVVRVGVEDLARLPRRPRDAHKGTCGTVLVVAGSEGMLGAAILAARGALRSGAGLVRVALPDALRSACAVAVPAATTIDRDRELGRALEDADAVVCGPGLGPGVRRLVDAVLARPSDTPIVLDADGLNAVAPLEGPLPGPVVLTPHPGEAARLLGVPGAATIQADREAAAMALVARSDGVVVLKGAGTVVGDSHRRFVNPSGNPGMATGGSGDVLAGVIGALLSQGMGPFDAAALGVHVHGLAGDRVAAELSETGLCAEDLPLAVARCWAAFEGFEVFEGKAAP
jgi:hydroxyethylthiazole kinase-like uncharacterized protein yjeF